MIPVLVEAARNIKSAAERKSSILGLWCVPEGTHLYQEVKYVKG